MDDGEKDGEREYVERRDRPRRLTERAASLTADRGRPEARTPNWTLILDPVYGDVMSSGDLNLWRQPEDEVQTLNDLHGNRRINERTRQLIRDANVQFKGSEGPSQSERDLSSCWFGRFRNSWKWNDPFLWSLLTVWSHQRVDERFSRHFKAFFQLYSLLYIILSQKRNRSVTEVWALFGFFLMLVLK